VAGTGWKWRVRKQNQNDNPVIPFDGDDEEQSQEDPVEKVFEHIWFGLQPVLFASIGTEIKFQLLVGDDNIIFTALMVLVFGLIVSIDQQKKKKRKKPFSIILCLDVINTIRI
jgi:NhaP-type Na+/H+ or K+/H+ antiporter